MKRKYCVISSALAFVTVQSVTVSDGGKKARASQTHTTILILYTGNNNEAANHTMMAY